MGYVFCRRGVWASGYTDASRVLGVWKVQSTLTCPSASWKDVEDSVCPWSVCACTCAECSVMSDSETPWTVAHQAPLFMGFSRREYWSGVPFPPLGDLPMPGIEPASLMSYSLARGFFTTSATWILHQIDFLLKNRQHLVRLLWLHCASVPVSWSDPCTEFPNCGPSTTSTRITWLGLQNIWFWSCQFKLVNQSCKQGPGIWILANSDDYS